ncbi:MAG: CoA transferase, partial [Pseudomonadota bacterium]
MTLPLPLEGVRVLSVEQYGAGPFGSLYLADMGADVVKIEPPSGPGRAGGDSSRHSGPHFLGENDSHFFQSFNRNKRSLTLDLKRPEGQAILRRLAPKFDAVMNNLRGDQQ